MLAFYLERAMLDREPVVQHRPRRLKQTIGGSGGRSDQVRRKRRFGRA
jgi:hypothetical protein